MLTQEILKDSYRYDENTGTFTRRKDAGIRWKEGEVAGTDHSKGYYAIYVNGKSHKAHRLAWLYIYGEMPPNDIDHINGDKKDNRIKNLRAVTPRENNKNKRKYRKNTSGVSGVYWDKKPKRWASNISVDGKIIWLGRYVEFSDAVNARKNAEVLYGFHENHGKDK